MGSRLGELTKNIPKGMLQLFGKTLIERQIEIYQKCGIDDITIVTGYKNNIIGYLALCPLYSIKHKNEMIISFLCNIIDHYKNMNISNENKCLH